MGIGIILGGVAEGYRKQREDQRAQDQQDFINDQNKRLKQAQSAPVPKLGEAIPDSSAPVQTADQIGQSLQLDPDKWAEIQKGDHASINNFLAGHAAANGMYMATPEAPAVNQPVVAAQTAVPVTGLTGPGAAAAVPAPRTSAIPVDSGAPAPAPVVASDSSTPAPVPAAEAPTYGEGPYQAYKTSTGTVYTNKIRAATTDDQLLARAGAYMAAGLEDRAIPLLQYATKNKMDQLQLDMAQNEATYAKTWKTANQAMLSGNWGQFQTAINKELADTGTSYQVSADKNGTVRMDTIDNRTGHLLGRNMFSTDAANNPNNLPDLQSFVGSMKDPATLLQFKQQMATQTYQHQTIEIARANTAISQQTANQQGAYQQGMLKVEGQRALNEGVTAGATAALARAQVGTIQQQTSLKAVIANPNATPQQKLDATNALRGMSGEGNLVSTFGQPMMPGQVVTNPDGTRSVVTRVGAGKDAVNVSVPEPVEANHTLMSDPYVMTGKVTPQWGYDPKTNKPVVVYVPAGSTSGNVDFAKAKQLFDQTHPGAAKSAPRRSAAGAPAPGGGWGQLPQVGPAVMGALQRAATDAGQVDNNSQ